MQTTLIKLGHRISELRQKNGLTQEKLAELVHYSPNHISKLESARTNPSFDLLLSIAKELNVSMHELFINNESYSNTELKEKLYKIIDKMDNKNLELAFKIIKVINS